MATYTEPLPHWPLPGGLLRPLTRVPASAKPTTRNLIRARRHRENPDTPAQRPNRTIASFLGRAWRGLDTESRATWAKPYAFHGATTALAFIAQAMDRWRSNEPPQATPYAIATPSEITLPDLEAHPTARAIVLTATPSAATNIWAVAFFRSDTPMPDQDHTLLLVVVPTTSTHTITWVDSDPPQATNYYRARTLVQPCGFGPLSAEVFSIPLP